MKKILVLLSIFSLNAFSLISDSSKYLLNNYMGPVANQVGLGTLIQNAEGVSASQITSSMILDGTIVSGDMASSAVATANIAAGAVTEAKLASGAIDGLNASRVARATFDVAVNGGTVGAHGLSVTLPAKALIRQAWYYVVTQFSDSGVGTVALSCEDANNILTATDITGITAGTITTGAETGTAATMVAAIGSACEITATVAGVTEATGKLIVYVNYVVAE